MLLGPLFHGEIMSYLYFVASEELSRVKIGITDSLTHRLAGIRTGSPSEVYLLGFVEFKYRDRLEKEEKRLHQVFKRFHVRLEWFNLTPELHREIDKYVFGYEVNGYNSKKINCIQCGEPIRDCQVLCIHCLLEEGPLKEPACTPPKVGDWSSVWACTPTRKRVPMSVLYDRAEEKARLEDVSASLALIAEKDKNTS